METAKLAKESLNHFDNMAKRAYFYCDPRSINDATNYYVNLIKDCLIERCYIYTIVHKLSDIKNPDVILTITERYFLCAKFRFSKAKTIYWAQGVSAEEAKMTIADFKGLLRYHFRRFAEAHAVNKSDILFCVSKRMVEYYSNQYGLMRFDRCVIMPCYNLPISQKFDEGQYKSPTFAYAGSSSAWQGVDFLLSVYKLVEEQLPSSRLIICTGDQHVFEQKVKELEIKNYEIKYVPVNLLQDELHKYKYGFILRDNHIVNQVATPTKMNSYLANYMIPIYSDSMQDFRDNIQLCEFTLMASTPLHAESVADKIVAFERTYHDFSKYKDIITKIFDSHYNDNHYKDIIKQMMDKWL